MSGGHAFHATWSPVHPVRYRMLSAARAARYLSVDHAADRIRGYEARGAVPQPGDVRARLARGEVITTHISEYELLDGLPCPDCENTDCTCPGAG